MSGLFITFEGPEGCGKTTQVSLLARHLRGSGHEVLTLREPGGTPLGNVVRGLLLGRHAPEFGDLTEAYLFATSRAELTTRVIRPALRDGATVLCDRYIDSSAVYQGIGRGLGVERVMRINAEAVGDCEPDLTLLFDVPADVGLARARARALFDRIEREQMAFHERVRRGFLDLAADRPGRYVVIDARPDPERVHRAVLDAVRRHAGEAPA